MKRVGVLAEDILLWKLLGCDIKGFFIYLFIYLFCDTYFQTLVKKERDCGIICEMHVLNQDEARIFFNATGMTVCVISFKCHCSFLPVGLTRWLEIIHSVR